MMPYYAYIVACAVRRAVAARPTPAAAPLAAVLDHPAKDGAAPAAWRAPRVVQP